MYFKLFIYIYFCPNVIYVLPNDTGLGKLSTQNENFGQNVRGQTIRAPSQVYVEGKLS